MDVITGELYENVAGDVADVSGVFEDANTRVGGTGRGSLSSPTMSMIETETGCNLPTPGGVRNVIAL